MMMPRTAERMIRLMGDNFFFLRCLYPNIEAIKSDEIMMALRLTATSDMVTKQFFRTM